MKTRRNLPGQNWTSELKKKEKKETTNQYKDNLQNRA